SGQQQFKTAARIAFPVPSGTWTVDVVVQPSTGDPGWGAGGRVLDVTASSNPAPSAGAIGHGDTVKITPTGVPGATNYVAELVDGRRRVVARTNVAPGGAGLVSPCRVETPYAELRLHALDATGRLLGQGVKTYLVRHRTGLGRFPVHFESEEIVL